MYFYLFFIHFRRVRALWTNRNVRWIQNGVHQPKLLFFFHSFVFKQIPFIQMVKQVFIIHFATFLILYELQQYFFFFYSFRALRTIKWFVFFFFSFSFLLFHYSAVVYNNSSAHPTKQHLEICTYSLNIRSLTKNDFLRFVFFLKQIYSFFISFLQHCFN